MSVGVAQPGVELPPACPLYIGLLPDEPVALGGPLAQPARNCSSASPVEAEKWGVCKGPTVNSLCAPGSTHIPGLGLASCCSRVCQAAKAGRGVGRAEAQCGSR